MQHLSLSLSKTVKKENATSFSVCPRLEPDVPPGFSAQPPRDYASAAADSPRNRSSTCAGDRVRRVYRRRSISSEQQSPRRTPRKRSRPQFYAPPPASSRRRRGRLPKAPLMSQSPRPRGRPPKAPLILSQLSRQETETGNPNQVSSTPSRKPQEQMTITEKSSSETESQVIQINVSPSPHSSVWPKTNIKRKTHDIAVDKNHARATERSTLETLDIEETLFDISLTEDQISPAIDSKILQHVANALHYMSGSQTDIDEATVITRSSDVDINLTHTLKAINEKHGDITKGSSLESDCMKTLVLLGICKVVEDLQNKSLKDVVDVGTLDSYYTTVRDAENMKVNVRWLHDRLDEIKDAVKLTDEAQVLVNEKNRRLENLDIKKNELVLRRGEVERLKFEIQDIEEQMAREVVMVEELNKRIGAQQSRFLKFQHAHLMDGLI